MKWWFRQELYVKILIGIICGLALGFLVGKEVSFIMKPIGEAFLRLLKMLIAPVVFFTIVSGITKMESVSNLRSVGGKLLLYYFITSVISVAIGLGIALVINPGKELVGFLGASAETVKKSDFNFINNMLTWIPVNPFESLAKTDVMQILFFSVFLGTILLILGSRVEKITHIFEEASTIVLKITDAVMMFSPYGIMALISELVQSMSGQTLAEVGKFILADYVALAIVCIIVYSVQLKLMSKINVLKFFKAIVPSILVAASTTSSAATLPINLNVAEKNLKLPEKIYGFGLTIGSSVNSNGMAVALGVIIVFSANIYGLELTLPFILKFGLVGVLLSMGTAGVKGAGIVLSSVILDTMGLPLTVVPLFAAIWPIIDIGHTTVNVVGDMVEVTLIAAREGEMDVEAFNNADFYEISKDK